MRKYTKKPHSLKIFVPFLAMTLCVSVILGLTSGCEFENKNTENQEQSNIDDEDFVDNGNVELDFSVSEAFLNNEGFEYEREAANSYYGSDDYNEPSNTYRNEWVYEYGTCAFDDSGNGVFVVEDPEAAGMNKHLVYIEYTSDYGKTWNICNGGFYSSYYFNDIKVVGKKVYFVLQSGASENRYILYSDDLCKSFKARNVAKMLPQYGESIFNDFHSVNILNIDKKDGSLILGLYDYNYVSYPVIGDSDDYSSFQETNYFLIAKVNSNLSSCNVIYADDKYIKNM